MDVIYDLMIFDVGIQALKMRVQASKMWILAKKIVKSAELYIDTIHPSIHPSTFKWHCEARMNRSWDLWRALTRWTFFLKWDPYNKRLCFCRSPLRQKGLPIPIIWLGNS